MTDSVNQSRGAKKTSLGGTLLKGALRILYKAVIPAVVVFAAVGFYKYQIETRPQAQRRPAGRQARLVRGETVQTETRAVSISAMGTVRSAAEVTLTPEVTGLVTYMDETVRPGGLINAGQVLYRIDSRDYETIVQQRQSEVARAELALRLEEGNQTVARQEFELLGDLIDPQDRELVLRKPQLQERQEALAAANAALAKAQLDVKRCTIRSPFNAVIKAKHADVGARVSPTSPLAVLTGTDEYWVETLVHMNQLHWIRCPGSDRSEGSAVQLYNSVWRTGQSRQGRVLRLMGQLEDAGRLAQIIVSVPDPLCLHTNADAPPLLIGSFVRVEIEGVEIPDVVVLSREYLRNGDSVWVMNDKGDLEIRRVKVVFRGRDAVYISEGLSGGERVIASDLSAPVDGMPLRLDSEGESSGEGR